jgi:hypothetical protein
MVLPSGQVFCLQSCYIVPKLFGYNSAAANVPQQKVQAASDVFAPIGGATEIFAGVYIRNV